MSNHECRRRPGEGFCRSCGRFMGDPAMTWKLDDWTDPTTIDRDPDDDPESIIYREESRARRIW